MIHPKTELEKDRRAAEQLKKLEQQYMSISLEEARARTDALLAEMNEIVRY